MTIRHHLPSRREALLGAGALFAWSQMPKLARAEGRDPRMLVIVLRGALDGLGAVAPVGDPDWIGLRGDRALVLDGKTAGAAARRLLRAQSGDAEPAPALQGAAGHHRARHGDALSRALAFRRSGRARKRDRAAGRRRHRLAQSRAGRTGIGRPGRSARQPRAWRRLGDAAGGARPGAGAVVGAATIAAGQRRHAGPPAGSLSAHRSETGGCARGADPPGRAWRRRQRRTPQWPTAPRLQPPGIARVRAYFAEAAGTAARFLAKPDGPRVGAMGFVGWDTHINEGAASGQLANLLGALDGALAAIETNMGDAWRETVVAVVTEFGRTARINGTNGTDHGTGTVAFLAGGALRGGRVIADWPGLKPAQLYEERDLKPTTDLRAVLKGLLRDHLRVEESVLASTVFPDSTDVVPTAGLVG